MNMPVALPPTDPVLIWLSVAVVILGCLVIGMMLTVIRLHIRRLRRTGTPERRLMIWHIVLISMAHTCFIAPIVVGILGYLGVLPIMLLLLRVAYLSGLVLSMGALMAIAVHIREQSRPPPLERSD